MLLLFASKCNSLIEFDMISNEELFESDEDVAVTVADLGDEVAVDDVDEKTGLE
jgi:hypothetical protein